MGIASTESAVTKGPPDKPKSTKSTRILPTDRIAFPKQLDILRAYAAVSGPGRTPVAVNDVANVAKMAPNTVSYTNSFFVDVGFLQRTDDGILPSTEVMSYHHAFGWNPENAAVKLAPVVGRAWFSQALLAKLRFRPLSEDEVLQDLAEAAGVNRDKESQLQVILTYMQATGIIVREGGHVRLSGPSPLPDHSPETNGKGPEMAKPTETDPPAPRPATIATAFTSSPTEGVVQFHVSVKVDMAEFAGWQPDRIKAFFSGIAQVLAAKGEMEKSTSQT